MAALAAASALAACSFGPPLPVMPLPVDAGRTAALVSSYRAQHGLGGVAVDSRLMQAAAAQARTMGERDRIGHGVGGALPGRVTAVAYHWGAVTENLGAGYRSLEAAMQGWRNSAGHRKNLLNPHVTEIGIAAVATPPGAKHRTYWALILAAPMPFAAEADPFQVELAQ